MSGERPGRYAMYPGVEKHPDEPTAQFLLRIEEERRLDELAAKLAKRGSSPPPKKAWPQIVTQILIAAALAGGAAALSVWRSSAVAEVQQAATERWIEGANARMNSFDADRAHTLEALSRVSTQLDGINARLDRIERQLDQQRSPQRPR